MIIKRFSILYILLFTLFAYPSKKDFSDAFIKVAEIGNPSVVSIISEKDIKQNFHYFFEPFNNQPPNHNKKQALGSGVIIDNNNGYIITNNHVIDEANEVKVLLFDKREFIAEIIATDPLSDLAIIKIDPPNLSSIKIGNSDKLKVGEWVIAIGSPFGLNLKHTVTAGIVSAIGRNDVISPKNFENFIQHDAAINPGNSGGALFNLNGELIGINTAIATDGFSRSNAGIGFAIPINMVQRIVDDLISKGKVNRGWLGVQIQDINTVMINKLGLADNNGALVSQVINNSPAQRAGIENKDVIIAVDDKRVNSSSELKNLISSGKPNEKTKLTVIRYGTQKNIVVNLGTRPDEEALINRNNTEFSQFDLLGLVVKYNNGVTVSDIDPKSLAIKNNILPGDIIIEIGEVKIQTIKDYTQELTNYSNGDTIMIRILRNDNPHYVAFEIE